MFKRKAKADQPRPRSSAECGWPLSDTLCYWSPNDPWTIGDACEGTQAFGATGSGKTSGTSNAVSISMLRHGFGGLVLCAKVDEGERWQRLADQNGRSADVIRMGSPGSKHGINFLDYEARRPGPGAGETENIVNVLMQAAEMASQKHGNAKNDDYWERTMKQMLRNAVEIVKLSRGPVSLLELYEIINSAPQDADQARSNDWQRNSPCFQYILQAEEKIQQDKQHEYEYQLSAKYWLQEFPQLADRTRSVIVSNFTSLADAFLRGKLRSLFCDKTTVVPELCQQGAIIILDIPVKEYAEVGQYGQVLFKYLFQKAMERRTDNQNGLARPCFIHADESHFFGTRYDAIFQSTARGSKIATVYLTQNLPNYYESMGGDEAGRARVQSLLGNLQTKIFHQNSEAETNRYAAEMIGRCLQLRKGFSGGSSSQIFQFDSKTSNYSASEQMDFDLQPREFTLLAKGGPAYNFHSEAIVFQGGKMFSNGKIWMKTLFNQKQL